MADPTVTPAAPASTDNTIDWTKLLYGIYKDQNPTQGKFQQVPMSPEQSAIYQKTFGWMNTGGPTNAALAPGIVANMKANNPEFTLPGYIGAQAGQPNALPNNGHVGGAPTDWDAMLKGLLNPAGGSSGAGPTTTTPGAGIGSPGGPGGGGVFAPVGSAGDPFANMPVDSNGSPTDWNSLIDAAKKYGPAAGEFAIALMQGNPFLSVKAGYDALKAYMGGNKSPQLPITPTTIPPGDLTPAGYTPPEPRHDLTPGSHDNPGITDPWSAPFLGSRGGGGGGLQDQPGGWWSSAINAPTRSGQYR